MTVIQESLFGKTFPERSVPTREKTSGVSSKPSAKLPIRPYLSLDIRKASGQPLGISWETVTQSRIGLSTRNTGEYPNIAVASTLSQILDLNAPEKYYLSKKACEGIIRRAKRRGKELPEMIKEALEEVVGLT